MSIRQPKVNKKVMWPKNLTKICNNMTITIKRRTLYFISVDRNCHSSLLLVVKLGDHVTPALRELHWLLITERIQYKLCLLVHKMFVGHAPDYIASLLMPASDIPSRSSLRSSTSSNCDLVVPRTSRKSADRSLSVAALRGWNRLPTDLKLLRSTASFKNKLKSSVSSCLQREHCVNSGMRRQCGCRRRTTSHCCYCYCSARVPAEPAANKRRIATIST